jgi:hypothetical protein
MIGMASMKRARSTPRVVVVCVACLLAGTAHAMEIRDFDRMVKSDQNEYVADLVIGAQTVLKQTGHPELATKVRDLFRIIKPGDQISDGMAEFEIILAKTRLAEATRLEKDPNARHLEVEHAMSITLKRNGVELPDSFFTVNKNFRPKFSPKP